MTNKNFDLIIKKKIKSFNKIITVDSDKSISIRSVLVGSVSENISQIKNILESEDVKSSIKCLKKLGVKIIKKNKIYYVHGRGLGSLIVKKNTILNFGNSGTLARLLIGLLSTTPNIEVILTGDSSLKKRNMKKLIILMSQFGATFYPREKFYFPLKLISSKMPIGINYKAGVSAQLKSAVLLAGLNSYGVTKIFEKELSRDHTEKMLSVNQSVLKIKKNPNKIIEINGKKILRAFKIKVSGDPSSAAFFCALTLMKKNSSIKILNVGLNPTRTGFYQLLKKHGANIKFKNLKKRNNEIIGNLEIKNCKLKPLKASKEYYVKATDEYPILFVLAALTKGTSIFKGIDDLANKESNRITEMQKILDQVGVKTIFKRGELKIFGKGLIEASSKKIKVKNLGDHRICMSTFILAALTGAKALIKNFETVNTSAPSFLKIMRKLGADFEIQK
jgi:3-phosphoshikimate 1-carboxyvinyltransferase